MRPHDIVVLLKICVLNEEKWRQMDLATSLFISNAEITDSLNRSMISGLVAPDKRNVNVPALLDFLVYGLRYVFPVMPGNMTQGMKTAYSASPLSELIVSEKEHCLVWPCLNGDSQGQSIKPLYVKLPQAAMRDQALYEILALTDALRIGRARERAVAGDELKRKLQPNQGQVSAKRNHR